MNQATNINPYQTLDFSTGEGRHTLARMIAEEGIVLLENRRRVLPIGKSKVALFGRTQIDTIKGGTGSANSVSEYSVCIQDGLRDAGIRLDETLAETYKTWAAQNPIPSYGVWGSGMHANPEMPVEESLCREARERGAEKAVIVIGRTAGENEDVALTEGDYYLSGDERNIFSSVKKYFDKVIVILNIGNVMDLNFLREYDVDGVVYMNMAGMEGGHAVGNVLAGKVTPSGHLTASFAASYDDYPSSASFGQRGGGLLQDYKEDIFVGYRYFETFGKRDRLLYPFGYGKSYTRFQTSDTRCTCDGETVKVQTTVTNVGGVYAGKYVWQIYVGAPQMGTGSAKLSKPARVLCGFAKTQTLAPGACETLTVCFPVTAMASYDDTGVSGTKSAFVLEAGEYKIYAGDSVVSAKKVGSYKQKSYRVVEKCHSIPTALSERLLADGRYEKLETIPMDPKRGLQIPSEGHVSFSVDLCADTDASAAETLKKEKSLSALRAGESVSYRFIVGASGRYYLSFVTEDAAERPLDELASLSVDEIPVQPLSIVLKNGESTKAEIILPSGHFTMKLTAKADMPAIRALCLEKKSVPVCVAASGVTEMGAEDYYESSYCAGTTLFPNDGTGQPCVCLTHLSRSGNFAVYKLNVEKGGVYDFSFRYADFVEDMTVNECMAIFVSNVGQSVADVPLYKTCEKNDANRNLKLSDPVQIALPNGECYLKLVTGLKRMPDLNRLYFKRNESVMADSIHRTTSVKTESFSQLQLEGLSAPNVYETPEHVEKKGIQLIDVYRDRSLMNAFLDQLSNEELAILVSGSSRNRTPLGTSGTTRRLPERGVPPAQSADGPLGLRLNTKTAAYPSGTLLASSFDIKLAECYGLAIGHEAKELQVDMWLAPGINIHRDPRCGRNFEYFSEDPLVAGRMAANIAKGVQTQGVAVTAKHFAVNNTEHERLKSNSRVSERAIREIYLKNFEICVKEGDPWCIMSSYNHVNNVKVDETRVLITDIPRDEWHWGGVFMTDWGNDSKHVLEIKAGHDLRMCSGDVAGVTAALNDGTLSREEVKICATRVMNMVMKTNTFLDMLK